MPQSAMNFHRALFWLCPATTTALPVDAVPKCDDHFRLLKIRNAVGTNRARISVGAPYSPVHGWISPPRLGRGKRSYIGGRRSIKRPSTKDNCDVGHCIARQASVPALNSDALG